MYGKKLQILFRFHDDKFSIPICILRTEIKVLIFGKTSTSHMSRSIILFLFTFIFCSVKLQSQNLHQVYDGMLIDFGKKKFAEVIKTGESVLANLSKNKRSQEEAYAMFAYFTGSACAELSQFEKGEPYLIDAIGLLRKMDDKKDELGNACNNLGNLYIQTGQYVKAEPLLLESLEVLRSKHPGYHEFLFPPYINLGSVYFSTGRFAKAESTLLELKNMLPDSNLQQNTMLKSNLAGLYIDMGKYDQAESAVTELMNFSEKHFGKLSIEYAYASLMAGKYFYTIKKYYKAEEFNSNSIFLFQKLNKEDNPDYIRMLNNQAYIYYFTGRFDKADSLFSYSMQIVESRFGKDFPLYGQASNGKAMTLLESGQYENVITLLKENLAINEKLKRTDDGLYTNMLNNLAIGYIKSGQYEKAEPILLKSLQLTESIFGKEHTEYKTACLNLGNFYWETNRFAEARKYDQLGMDVIKTEVQQIFSYSSEEEKLDFLRTEAIDKNRFYSFIYQSASKEHSGDLYDMVLYSKGLLLNSTKQVTADILNSKDSTAIQLYDDWQSNKKQMAFWYSKPISERKINLDSLKQMAEQHEKQLVRISSVFQKKQESSTVNWKIIQQQLKPGEAAIEFMQFYYFDKSRFTDSLLYAALILKNDGQSPEMVTLFEEKQLDSLLQNQNTNNRNKVDQLYSTKPGRHSLYDLIWSGIDKKLNNIHTVYFSPIGLLYKISIAAIPINETTLLSDKYRLIQLNSTQGLMETAEQKISPADTLILYGGITYDADSTKLKMQAGMVTGKADAIKPVLIKDDKEQSWNYLPFSKLEVEEINKKGQASHYPVTIISGENATEESLKALNGKRSPAVLHIASHGFFFPDPKEEKNNIQTDQNVFKYSSDPLLRSGLFFAGAYYTWTKNKPVAGIEDGILTAYEIANMYLPNTKLAVLSACETGLGDLNGSEGVLGLQRAFRMAGVKNLVMSLWKVPDAETAEFMAIFYENIFKQQTIPDAFYAAQTAMKNKYRNDPYKWAAFILVR